MMHLTRDRREDILRYRAEYTPEERDGAKIYTYTSIQTARGEQRVSGIVIDFGDCRVAAIR
jgi:hypothetical protein